MTEADKLRREDANLRSILEPDVPPGLEELLGSCREFTGATLALMQQTRNEWLHRLPVAQMENHYFATLCWLYIQAGPEREVRRMAFASREDFINAAIDWGNAEVDGKPRITPDILAAADKIIEHTLALIDEAQISVEEKPGAPKSETPPPNS